jgi:glycosyltransferase involved in cell wall biosynthesis
MPPDLSIVICTNRTPAHLRTSLEAIERQTIRERLEVVVVDDGAPEPLAALCQKYGAALYRHPRNLGLAAARNTGWKATAAPLVAFTDDDCRPQPRWAEVLRDAYTDPLVVAVGGQVQSSGSAAGFLSLYYALSNPIGPLEIELAESRSLLYRLRLYMRKSVHVPQKTTKRPVFSLPGASMSLRRSALELVGGFDPGIRFGGEDEDLFYRLRKVMGDGILLFEPAAVTDHDFVPTLGDAWRRARSYGRGNARNFVKHPEWGPTVFPAPLLALALVAVGMRRPLWLGAAALSPVAVFPRWALESVRRHRPDIVAFAYLQLLEEAASDIGFASGYLHFRGHAGALRS